jgi:peptidoglycan/xylan/chitin deacetylase (PgdA/CDA1 family)
VFGAIRSRVEAGTRNHIMNHRGFENRPPSLSAGRYLERLSKALPGKAWSRTSRDFWPDGAKLVISISLQFDIGGSSEGSARTPVAALEDSNSALAKWYEYGFKEGIPRLLDVFQRRHVRVTAHIPSPAIDHDPQLAREIVERGYEAAARGQTASPQHHVSPEEERRCCEATVLNIQRATGIRPVGFDTPSVRGKLETVEILQDLGFVYHSDDVSRDEPFLVSVRGKPFVVIPRALGITDSVAFASGPLSSDQYASELKNQFEMLYSESETRRRMMSIPIHGHITGQPARAKAMEEFIIYAQRRPAVVFMRKDEIARFALSSSITPCEEEMKKGREAA